MDGRDTGLEVVETEYLPEENRVRWTATDGDGHSVSGVMTPKVSAYSFLTEDGMRQLADELIGKPIVDKTERERPDIKSQKAGMSL